MHDAAALDKLLTALLELAGAEAAGCGRQVALMLHILQPLWPRDTVRQGFRLNSHSSLRLHGLSLRFYSFKLGSHQPCAC